MDQQTWITQLRELKQLSRYTRMPEAHVEGRDRFIRFLDSYSTDAQLDPIVDSLCIHFGLYPYMMGDRSGLSTSEALAVKFHRPASSSREDFIFHEEQAAIFYRLLDGKNVILSAPTSFGKSVILDALVASQRWHNIVVIVPTVALIDEVRRRLVPFVDRYTVITHPSQAPGEDNIYVLTQERFLELRSVPRADLFMIDEFYKLGSSDADDQRMSMLNIAWRQLRSTGSQFYLTGPNISALARALDDELQASLFVSDYRTVAVDLVDRSFVADDDRLQDMADLWPSLSGSTLVFASVPNRADRVAVDLGARAAVTPPTPLAIQVAEWVGINYHPQWGVVLALSQGVASHSGPLPRSLQRMLIRLFESGDIRTMVCTTTLIEGVNTTAKNVIIYDKRIDRRPIDYFTFCNVRGRAGRMSNHFVGNVITYMPPPAAQPTEVDIPIDSQSPGAPLSLIVQLPPAELTPASADRLEDVYNQEELSLTTIQRNVGYDPELQVAAARRLRASRRLRRDLTWTGYPTNAQAKATLTFALENLLSPRQRQRMTVTRLWGMLNAVRFNHGDMATSVAQQARYKRKDEDTSDVVSQVLAFQRNWMGFQIPSLLRAVETIQRDVARGMAEPRANYTRYITDVENVFMEQSLLDLDEYGLPLPLALRLTQLGMVTTENTAETLASFVRMAQRSEVRSQLSSIELWIIDDVLVGLGVQAQEAR